MMSYEEYLAGRKPLKDAYEAAVEERREATKQRDDAESERDAARILAHDAETRVGADDDEPSQEQTALDDRVSDAHLDLLSKKEIEGKALVALSEFDLKHGEYARARSGSAGQPPTQNDTAGQAPPDGSKSEEPTPPSSGQSTAMQMGMAGVVGLHLMTAGQSAPDLQAAILQDVMSGRPAVSQQQTGPDQPGGFQPTFVSSIDPKQEAASQEQRQQRQEGREHGEDSAVELKEELERQEKEKAKSEPSDPYRSADHDVGANFGKGGFPGPEKPLLPPSEPATATLGSNEAASSRSDTYAGGAEFKTPLPAPEMSAQQIVSTPSRSPANDYNKDNDKDR